MLCEILQEHRAEIREWPDGKWEQWSARSSPPSHIQDPHLTWQWMCPAWNLWGMTDISPSSRVRVFCWEWQPRFPCWVEQSLLQRVESWSITEMTPNLHSLRWRRSPIPLHPRAGKVQFPQSIQLYYLMVLRLHVLCKIFQIQNIEVLPTIEINVFSFLYSLFLSANSKDKLCIV